MHVEIMLKFDTDDRTHESLNSVMQVLHHTLPYMVDNVRIEHEVHPF